MEQNQIKRKEKMEQKQYKKKILEQRIKELNSKLEEKEGKGEVQVLNGKGILLENTKALDQLDLFLKNFVVTFLTLSK